MFWNQYPHPGILRKFAREGAAVSSRNSSRIRSPLGGTAERGGAGRRLCRSRADTAKRRRCASAGRTRARRCVGRHGGRFRRGKPGRSFRAAGRQRGAGGAWPRGAHKGRVSGATARGGQTCRAAGRGRYTAAFRGGRGEGVSRAAVYGGRDGYSRGRRAYCRGAAGGGPGRAKNALSCAACVGLRATGGKDGSSAGEKARFRYIMSTDQPKKHCDTRQSRQSVL